MTRLLVAVFACVFADFAYGFPGLRRWPSSVRIPQEVSHALPVRLPDRSELPEAPRQAVHLSLPDLVRNAVMCCKDMTAECMACATNQDLSHFCSEHSRIPGCERILEKAKEKALDGVVNKAVEKMAERVGGAKAEQIVDRYLARNPDIARKNLMNLTSEAFDTVSSIKKSLLKPKGDDDSDEERTSMLGKKRKFVEQEDDDYDEEDDDEDLYEDEQELPSKGIKLKAKKTKHHRETSSFSLSELQRNPWVVAVCSLLITAVSTGIAVGALCHSRISAQAREPLLSTLLQDVEPRTPSGAAEA